MQSADYLVNFYYSQMLNLYIDPHGEKIFSKSTPVTGVESADKLKSTAQHSSTPEAEKITPSMEETLRGKDRRISELEKELSLIKVGRLARRSMGSQLHCRLVTHLAIFITH